MQKLIDYLASSGTGKAKLDIIAAKLDGVKPTVEPVVDRLAGHVSHVTLEKVVSFIRHGPPKDKPMETFDAARYVTRSAFDAETKRASEQCEALAARVDVLEKIVAGMEAKLSVPSVQPVP